MTPMEVFDVIKPEYVTIKRVVGTWFAYSEKYTCDLYMLDIDYSGTKDVTFNRPVDYSKYIGCFGKFWDSDEEPNDSSSTVHWGYFTKKSPVYDWFISHGGSGRRHFKPGLPKERIDLIKEKKSMKLFILEKLYSIFYIFYNFIGNKYKSCCLNKVQTYINPMMKGLGITYKYDEYTGFEGCDYSLTIYGNNIAQDQDTFSKIVNALDNIIEVCELRLSIQVTYQKKSEL